jgi:hypothetical protein
MAYVLRNGKRYRFSIPYKGDTYHILRYDPVPDTSGIIGTSDFMLILCNDAGNFSIECDGEDAAVLERLIDSLNSNTRTPAQFEEALAAFVQETFTNSDDAVDNEESERKTPNG